jgi:hypothetical protein
MSLRSTILACVTTLCGIAVVIAFLSNRERYSVVGGQSAIYVFDKKTATINYCNDKTCQLITPQGTTIEAMRVMAGMPAQNAIVQQAQPVSAVNGSCPNGCTVDPKAAKPAEANLTSLQTLTPAAGASGTAPMGNLVTAAATVPSPYPTAQQVTNTSSAPMAAPQAPAAAAPAVAADPYATAAPQNISTPPAPVAAAPAPAAATDPYAASAAAAPSPNPYGNGSST